MKFVIKHLDVAVLWFGWCLLGAAVDLLWKGTE